MCGLLPIPGGRLAALASTGQVPQQAVIQQVEELEDYPDWRRRYRPAASTTVFQLRRAAGTQHLPERAAMRDTYKRLRRPWRPYTGRETLMPPDL